MDHGLVNRVGGLVREDAGREARDELDDPVLPAGLEDVILHEDVQAPELHLRAG